MNQERNPPVAAPLEHLSLLLAKLDPVDSVAAGQSYEALRGRLILYFRLRRPQEAEDLADRVLDRVARRIAEGVNIESVSSFAAGVAKFVLQEHYASTLREERAWNDLDYSKRIEAMPPDEVTEARAAALAACLESLTASERNLILNYYGADGLKRMRERQSIARRLRISLNALHNRALRLRKQLEQCVESRRKLEAAT